MKLISFSAGITLGLVMGAVLAIAGLSLVRSTKAYGVKIHRTNYNYRLVVGRMS